MLDSSTRATAPATLGMPRMLSTTVLAVRDRNGEVAMAGDGQVTLGQTVLKAGAVKVRKLFKDSVLAGFAGASGDALTIFELFEQNLDRYSGNVQRAAVELGKKWRSDRYLRRMEAMLLVASKSDLLIISGNGEVLCPDESFASIGSGSAFAIAALKALWVHTDLAAPLMAEKALGIAADLCIYTNSKTTVLAL